ncbi:MAG: hypothetical protein DMD91_26370 [Candidatus Rokuibacteriota bacterium]|nr:MAG: hypothetical protein DMD91_26370 [Candidatus Rokubacteria bacterium]
MSPPRSIFRGVKVIAAVLGAVLLVLTPLAHGSPIDPSSPGFWDNGDFDDVILLLTSNLHVLEAEAPPSLRTSDVVARSVLECPAGVVIQRADDPGPPRAPPAL